MFYIGKIDESGNNQYFGTVRFFRHLLISFFILVFFISISSIIILLYKNSCLTEDIDALKVQITKVETKEEGEEIFEGIPQKNLSDEDKSYMGMFPDLYNPNTEQTLSVEENTLFLTFDDGPSLYTGRILDILRKHDVKATFFVVGRKGKNGHKEYNAILKRIVDEGHSIAAHSYTHRYLDIYSSVEAWLVDYYRIFNAIYDATGQKVYFFRYPGGSNVVKDSKILLEMKRRGFVYYDWNISAADTAVGANIKSIIENIVNNVERVKSPRIILMHDGNLSSFRALEKILSELEAKGYKFSKLSTAVVPLEFAKTNLN